jgi:hypothetical protein
LFTTILGLLFTILTATICGVLVLFLALAHLIGNKETKMTDLDHMSALKESIRSDQVRGQAPKDMGPTVGDPPVEVFAEDQFVAPLSGTITLSNFMKLDDPEKHAFIERGGMIAGL